MATPTSMTPDTSPAATAAHTAAAPAAAAATFEISGKVVVPDSPLLGAQNEPVIEKQNEPA